MEEAAEILDSDMLRNSEITQFPYLFLQSGGGQIVETWGRPSIFEKVKEAFLWSEIKIFYIKEKKWYEKIANAGKVIMVRDSPNEQWRPDIFKRYNRYEKLFVCEHGWWKYSKELPESAVKLEH
jgi:hypothetical protein